jgi:hypothetical protein
MFPSILTALAGFLFAIACAAPAQAQHDGDLAVFATASSGGQLVLDGVPEGFVLVQPGFCAGGLCLYSATDPGFGTPATAPGGLFPLKSGTTVRVEIVSISAPAALKVGATVLDAPGESAVLGTTPGLHVHPAWQMTLPKDAMEQRTVTIRVAAPGSDYAASAARSLILSTFVPSPTTTTTSASTTTTSTTSTTVPLEPFCGDCLVSEELGEDCDEGGHGGLKGRACTKECTWGQCGDPDHNGRVTASDASFILRAAVSGAGGEGECTVDENAGGSFCHLRVCDMDGSGKLTSADALRVLRRAVGQNVLLKCPGA